MVFGIPDAGEKARYRKRLADQGDSVGQYYYDFCLENGKDVVQHFSEAVHYYYLAQLMNISRD
jgi:TPR repeat protein